MCFAVKRSIATVPAVLIKIPLSILADLFFKLYTSVHFFFFILISGLPQYYGLPRNSVSINILKYTVKLSRVSVSSRYVI